MEKSSRDYSHGGDDIPPKLQESLATAIALTHDDNANAIAAKITTAGGSKLFDAPLNLIVEKALAYRKTHGGKPPGRGHIGDLFAEILDDKEHKQHGLISNTIGQMCGLEADHSFNTTYLLGFADHFLKRRILRVELERAVKVFQQQNKPDLIDEVLDIAEGLRAKLGHVGKDRLQIISAVDIQMLPISWRWPNYFPVGKMVCVAGLPDVGKSITFCGIAATMSCGGKWPDGTSAGDPENVLFMTTEDTLADIVKPRLAAAGADMTRIDFLEMEDKVFSFKKDLPLLEAKMKERRYGAVFIEPFLAFFDGVDTYRSAEIQRAMAPLIRLMEQHLATLFANIHFNKNAEALAIDRISDARGLGATFRASYGVVPDPDNDDEFLFLKIKNNVAPRNLPGWKFRFNTKYVAPSISAPYIEWIGEDTRNIDAVLSGKKDHEKSVTKKEVAKAWLLGMLHDEARYEEDIKVAAEKLAKSFSWGTLRRARDELGIVPKKEKVVDGQWYWRLPKS